jgi:hypothetical protein
VEASGDVALAAENAFALYIGELVVRMQRYQHVIQNMPKSCHREGSTQG